MRLLMKWLLVRGSPIAALVRATKPSKSILTVDKNSKQRTSGYLELSLDSSQNNR